MKQEQEVILDIELTRNEKRVLKELLRNARASDSEIASVLGITSQAIGKIRRKLETTVIQGYSADLNYSKLGIKIFAIAIAKLTREGRDKGELEVEQELLRNPHVISVYRIPKTSSTHILLYGFRDMNELDEFFHSLKIRKWLHDFIETQELFTFSHNSLVKNSPAQLFSKVIEEGEKGERYFSELKAFKKRLSRDENS